MNCPGVPENGVCSVCYRSSSDLVPGHPASTPDEAFARGYLYGAQVPHTGMVGRALMDLANWHRVHYAHRPPFWEAPCP